MPLCILTYLHEVPQDKNVRHLRRGDQSHQVQVEIGISCRGHEEAVPELGVGAIEVDLPDTPAQSRRLHG